MRRLGLALAGVALLLPSGVARAAWSPPFAITPPGDRVQSLSLELTRGGDIEAVGTPQAHIDGVAAYWSRAGRPFEVQRLNGAPGDSPSVALDGAGNAIVQSYRINTDRALRIYEKPPGGRYGRARLLDPRPSRPYGLVTSPRGDVFSLWERSDRMGSVSRGLRVAVHPPGGRFGTVQKVSDGDDYFVGLVFDAAGNALLAWTVPGRLAYAIRPRGGSFGPPRTLSTTLGPPYSAEFDVAANGAGRAAIVWRDHSPAGGRQVRAAFGTVAGGFGPSSAIGGKSSRGPYVTIDRGGETVAAWRGGKTAQRLNVTAAIARPGAGFGPARVVHRGYVQQLGVLDNGLRTARLVWLGSSRILSARHEAGEKGFSVQTVAGSDAYLFRTGVTSDGRTILTWRSFAHGHAKRVKAAVARPGHSFGAVRTLDRLGPGRSFIWGPRVETGRGGDALVYWDGNRDDSDASRWRASWLEP